MKAFAAIVALLMLVACAPSQTPEQQAFLEALANRPVTCRAGKDCEDKWNRAIEWVTDHSANQIKTLTDNLITTNMVYAGGGRPVFKTPEFTVVKYKKTGNTFVIVFHSYCDEGFACNPSGLKLRGSFVTFVLGPPPGVKQTGPDSYSMTVHKDD